MYQLIIVFLFIVFFLGGRLIVRKATHASFRNLAYLVDRVAHLKTANVAAERKFGELEGRISDAFFVYELARDISPILNKDRLLYVFREKLKAFADAGDIRCSDQPKNEALNYELKTESPRYLSVTTSAKKMKDYLPFFVYQLNLSLERIGLYERLERISLHDSLTQVYNRRYFMERFYGEFERAQKFSLDLSFLMVDIDYFKRLNDMYGHITGDVVLSEIARILKESVREIDFVARFGGEEFAVILTETSKDDAIVIAERIIKKIAAFEFKAFDEKIRTTVSIGVATYPVNTHYSDMLVEIADKALYKAKQSGRNTVSWF